MRADNRAVREFDEFARAVFSQVGVRAPLVHEAIVLTFDTAAWSQWILNALSLIDDDERSRARRFRFPRHHDAYVLSHALWRASLGFLLGKPAARVSLDRTSAGRPLIPGFAAATSLSRSGTWAAVGFAAGVTLGVDIERNTSRFRPSELIPAVCSPSEIERLQAMPHADRRMALLQLWTRKEALLKAFGVGLRVPPSSIEAGPGDVVGCPGTDPEIPACRVHDLTLENGLRGALAVPKNVREIKIYQLDGLREYRLVASDGRRIRLPGSMEIPEAGGKALAGCFSSGLRFWHETGMQFP